MFVLSSMFTKSFLKHLQVFSNLQPLNISLSHMGAMKIVKKISQDHDVEVQVWCDELARLIRKPVPDVSQLCILVHPELYVCVL